MKNRFPVISIESLYTLMTEQKQLKEVYDREKLHIKISTYIYKNVILTLTTGAIIHTLQFDCYQRWTNSIFHHLLKLSNTETDVFPEVKFLKTVLSGEIICKGMFGNKYSYS